MTYRIYLFKKDREDLSIVQDHEFMLPPNTTSITQYPGEVSYTTDDGMIHGILRQTKNGKYWRLLNVNHYSNGITAEEPYGPKWDCFEIREPHTCNRVH